MTISDNFLHLCLCLYKIPKGLLGLDSENVLNTWHARPVKSSVVSYNVILYLAFVHS